MKSYVEILEYPKILERLSHYTDFSGGAELVLSLMPVYEFHEAQERLALTTEARAFLMARPGFNLGGVTDIRPRVAEARHSVVLEPGDLLQVRDTLLAVKRVHRVLTSVESNFPGLADIAWRLVPNSTLTDMIGRVLSDRGEVLNNASPELARIRHELQTTQARIQDRLQKMVASSGVAPYLQESIITRRGGRFVIPVKADFKGQVRGVVQDRSASGVTLFVEPLQIVELNNALRELQLAEQGEIRRLLLLLTAQVADSGDEIEATLAALAELDLVFAKARYAEEIGATEPELLPIPHTLSDAAGDNQQPGTVVKLFSARHPLLDPDAVVPIDAVLDEATHFLVITGPNTGGKTVTLKTVGLLVLMAQAGLHIPVAAGSVVSCFEAVYADIGDEQSIEQSLSTFSAHLANITSFLKKVDHRSLILLDELGAGTDPAEGAALARALLDAFRQSRCTVFVATHYPELKLYAHATPGVRNASMAFDLETLSPTYHLSIGLPGRSNAFAIARQLGLPEGVIKQAEGMLSGEDLRAEDMLEDLHALRVDAARARDAARAAQQDAEAQAAALRNRLRDIERERQEIFERAESEAQVEVSKLREEFSALRKRLATFSTVESREATLPVEKELEELEGRVSAVGVLGESVVSKLEIADIPDADFDAPRTLPQTGDRVRITSLGMQGTLVGLEDGEALIQAGAMRTRVPFDDLVLVERASAPQAAEPVLVSRPKAVSPGMQTDLRGMTVDEALTVLGRYLDDASLAGLPWVRIIHGKGTGTLRREVRNFLNDHPLVSSYASAADRDGGNGVTVAKLVTV